VSNAPVSKDCTSNACRKFWSVHYTDRNMFVQKI